MIDEHFSHYRIISKLGVGGMGEVYLAEDTQLRRKVALKVLPEALANDKERLSRFEQEAFAASALNHPNILTIHEFGVVGETHFLASEFVDGETLRDRLQRAPLSRSEAVGIAVQTAQALAAAHEARIIHRDIKPENIMLRRDGIVKVLDFGLAKLVEAPKLDRDLRGEDDDTLMQPQQGARPLTSPGMVMGTVAYMSPEQARGNPVDARTDVFSLGVVLYEMVMGHQPFTGETISHVIVAILEQAPPPLSPDSPAELTQILKNALAKNPDDRYESTATMLSELRKLQRRLERDEDRDSSRHELQPAAHGTLMQKESAATSPQSSPATADLGRDPSRREGRRKALWAGLVVLCLAILAGGFYVYHRLSFGEQIESMAVLPFVNESGSADAEYLSDGMTETLINSLSQLPNVNVKARSSVFRYKGKELDLKKIASELNVKAVLTGRVVQRGDQVTLNLELIDAGTENVLWGHRYESKSSELLSLQTNIARDVSGKLKSRLSGVEETKVTKSATSDPEAYQAYLKGRYYWNRRTAENLRKAIEQFKFATDRDPSYALAYLGLADCHAVLPEYAGVPHSQAIPQAKAYAQRALSLDGQLAEAYATLGICAANEWQWADSERNYKRAIEMNPQYPTTYHWYSVMLKDVGRYDESAAMIKKAQELDPLSSVIAVNVARILLELKDDPAASIESALRIIDLDPNFASAHEYLGLAYLRSGRSAEAISELEKAASLNKRAGITLGDLGHVYARSGRRAEALAIIRELEAKYARKEAHGQYIAAVYAGLGEKDRAFEWLEKDFEIRSGKLGEIRWTFAFSSLKSDARFKDLLRRIGQPE
jgi:serine/threonine-protein kinase